jgi:hypothetical protein
MSDFRRAALQFLGGAQLFLEDQGSMNFGGESQELARPRLSQLQDTVSAGWRMRGKKRA